MKIKGTFTNSVREVLFIAQKLKSCNNEILSKVATTYKRWQVKIAKGIAKNKFGYIPTNAKMETANDVA